MSIIIGSGGLVGADAAGVGEHLGLAGHVLHVGVAGDAPDVAVEVHGRLAAHPGEGLVVVAGPEGAAAEVDVVAGGVVGHGRSLTGRQTGLGLTTGIHTSAQAAVTRMSELLQRDLERLDGGRLGVPLGGDGGQLVGHVGLEVGQRLRLLLHPVRRASRRAGPPRCCGCGGWRGCRPCGRSMRALPPAAEHGAEQVAGAAHELVGLLGRLGRLGLVDAVLRRWRPRPGPARCGPRSFLAIAAAARVGADVGRGVAAGGERLRRLARAADELQLAGWRAARPCAWRAGGRRCPSARSVNSALVFTLASGSR